MLVEFSQKELLEWLRINLLGIILYGGDKMIKREIKNQDSMESFKFDNSIEFYCTRYGKDLKFLFPWVQDESNINKKPNPRRVQTFGNELKNKKFIEFIEANTI